MISANSPPADTRRERLQRGLSELWRTVKFHPILSILSPTWALADSQKSGKRDGERSNLIKRLNTRYLTIGCGLFVLAWACSPNDAHRFQQESFPTWAILPIWYLISRCNEVFYAFYRDAFAKLGRVPEFLSDLSGADRVRLALKSYGELILNFALLYALFPKEAWGSHGPKAFPDFLSYSASTITTSGGNGFAASHWALGFLTCYEIFCGLMLLVVCFAIYTGRSLAEGSSEGSNFKGCAVADVAQAKFPGEPPRSENPRGPVVQR